jgi:hypothetical protein
MDIFARYRAVPYQKCGSRKRCDAAADKIRPPVVGLHIAKLDWNTSFIVFMGVLHG